MKTTVIMCTRNRLPFLVRFTSTLYKQILLPDEFVIIDSSDYPINQDKEYQSSIVKKKPDGIVLKYYHSLPGLTLQRNIGVKQSSGDILFFFDDDIILEDDFINAIVSVFNSNLDYFGGVGTMTNYDNPSWLRMFKEKFRGFWGVQRSYGDGKFFLSGFPKFPYGTNKMIDTEILGGGLTAYKRTVFDHFSFDENVTGYSFMEDVDFSRRVTKKFKCFYQPLARCEHRHAATGRGNVRENRKMLMVNFRYFYFKNFHIYNKWSIFHHWFAIIGLFTLNIGINKCLGLIDGLREFNAKRNSLLN